MTLSIFTPTHDPKYLPQVYASLKAQTDTEWEWDVLYNNGAKPIEFGDERVRAHVLEGDQAFIGALKAAACERARGDLLLELDHDDLLAPSAVAEAKKALSGEAQFAYSNAIHCDANFANTQPRFNGAFGWGYRQAAYNGHVLDEPITFKASPASVSRIWYAPNHFRAFTRELYEKAGGYATDMRVLDDQDLMCRMYQHSDFAHIDQGLYVYRIHGENAWLKHNAEIQANVWRLYDKYVEPLALAWASRSGLRKLELGGAIAAHAGYETVDRANASICCDLDRAWPFADSSVGVIRAFDIFEHLRDPLHTMRECYRVLAPGGWILAQVPSTDGRGAFQDPTHRSFWNENSWLYYSNRKWGQYVGAPVRFQAARCYTTAKDAREVCWTVAHLVSLKDGYRPPGLIDI